MSICWVDSSPSRLLPNEIFGSLGEVCGEIRTFVVCYVSFGGFSKNLEMNLVSGLG